MILIIPILFICGFIGAVMAGSRGRSAIGWFVICFLTGLIGIIILAAIGSAHSTAAPVAAIAQTAALDRRRWQNLVDVDPDIAAAAAEIRQLGPIYEDMLAERYLSLNDKAYLSALVAKVKAEASSDASSTSHGDKGQIGRIHYRRLASGEFVVTKGKSVGKSFARYSDLEEFAKSA